MGTPSTLSPDFSNKPSGPAVVIDPTTFNRETEKNILPLQDRAMPSGVFGTTDSFRLPNRGIMSKLVLVAEISVTTLKGTGAITKRDRWMHGLIKNLVIKANGTNIHNVDGMDLRVLRQVVTRSATDSTTSDTVNGAVDATYTCTVVWEVPLAVDQYSLVGALFAESDANYFEVNVSYAQKAELFDLTGTATVSITGTLKSVLTTFDVVRVKNQQGQPIVVIPDLSHVYMLQTIAPTIPGNGSQPINLSKIDGTLLRALMRVQNGTAAGQDGFDLSTLARINWQYGVNQLPQQWVPAKSLTYENQTDYNGVLPFKYAVVDFVQDNAERDSVDPHGVADPQIVFDFGSSTINANATISVCQETLVRAAGFAATPAYR